MKSFREEISRLIAKHFSPAQVKEKSTKLARELERLLFDAPGDTRRVLRRIADGNLGRLPGLEALGARFSRQSRTACICHCFRGSGDRRLNAVDDADGRLARRCRRGNAHHRNWRDAHPRRYSCLASRSWPPMTPRSDGREDAGGGAHSRSGNRSPRAAASGWGYDVTEKDTHHPRVFVLEDVAMEHPFPDHQLADLDGCGLAGRNVDCIQPSGERRQGDG